MSKLIQLQRKIRKLGNHFVKPDDLQKNVDESTSYSRFIIFLRFSLQFSVTRKRA